MVVLCGVLFFRGMGSAQNKQIVVESVKPPSVTMPNGELKVMPPTAHTGAVVAAALSPNGQTLATAALDGTIRLWETATRRTWRVLRLPSSELGTDAPDMHCLHWLHDGQHLLAGGADRLCLWDVQSGKLLFQRVLASETDANGDKYDFDLQFMAPSRDEKHVLVGGIGKLSRVELCSLRDGESERKFGGVKELSALSWADNEASVVAVSEEFENSGLLRWNAATGTALPRATFELRSTLALSADAKLIFARHWNTKARNDNEGALIETATGHELRILPGGFNCAAFSPDGKWLVLGHDDGTLSALELATGREVQAQPEEVRGIVVEAAIEVAHDSTVNSLTFRPDGQFLVSTGERTARLWNWPALRPQATFNGYSLAPDLTLFSADGRLALTSTSDFTGAYINSSLRLWSVATGRTLRFFACDKPIETLWLAPDASYAFSGSKNEGQGDPEIFRWDLSGHSAPILFAGHTNAIHSLALSADGKTLLSGSQDLTMRLWNAQNGALIRTVDVNDQADKVGFNAQGNAVCLHNDTLSTWDANTGAKLIESDLRQQTWPALPDMVFRVPLKGDAPQAQFTEGGQTLLQQVEYDEGRQETLIERDAQSGAIKGIFGPSVAGHNFNRVSFTPDGTRALMQDNAKKELILWDVAANRVLQTAPNRNYFTAELVPGSQLFMATGQDDISQLCNLQNGQALLSYLTLKNGDWLAYLPDGRFDGSPGGMEKVYFQQGNQTFALDQFAERFYQPGLVDLVLRGTGLLAAPNPATLLA